LELLVENLVENKLREHAFDVLLERERRKGIHVES
jgi:hypothetical protein